MAAPAEKRVRKELSHYEVLGVPTNVTPGELQKRYRRLALENHPDRNVGREDEVKARFQRITESYNVLLDPAEREKYDSRRNVNFSRRVASVAQRAARAGTAADREATETDAWQPESATAASSEEDAEYSPSYGTSASCTHIADVSVLTTHPRRVIFTVSRAVAADPIGLKLDPKTLRVRGAVEGSAADAAGLPIDARLVAVDGTEVASVQDFSTATSGRTTMELAVVCDVQRIRVRRGSLAPPPEALAPLVASDALTEQFASPAAAVARLGVGADGGVRLAPGEASSSLTLREVGPAWRAVGGRRVVAVGGRAVDGPVRLAESDPLHDEDAVVPSVIAARRRVVELDVVVDAPSHA